METKGRLETLADKLATPGLDAETAALIIKHIIMAPYVTFDGEEKEGDGDDLHRALVLIANRIRNGGPRI